jgi:hypothetical protein
MAVGHRPRSAGGAGDGSDRQWSRRDHQIEDPDVGNPFWPAPATDLAGTAAVWRRRRLNSCCPVCVSGRKNEKENRTGTQH